MENSNEGQQSQIASCSQIQLPDIQSQSCSQYLQASACEQVKEESETIPRPRGRPRKNAATASEKLERDLVRELQKFAEQKERIIEQERHLETLNQ